MNLNHGNPYLKLGPFKYELKSAEPEIAIVHQLISIQEAENVKELARNKMRSTPYIDGGKDKSFSKGRTSKVMYMNEKLVPQADAVSKKIEMLTRMTMKGDKYASENFQVMNYGIGGKISSHIDSFGEIFSEAPVSGGKINSKLTFLATLIKE